MTIDIIHPTRGRIAQAEKALKAWLENAKDKTNINFYLSVDKDDILLDRYNELCQENGVTLHVEQNKSAIEAINRSAGKTNGDIIIVISDDFNEVPLYWDEILLKELNGKTDFIIKTMDGIQETLITLPILHRDYYNRFGYVYYGGYSHLWADTEMTVVGHYLGKVIKLPINFIHNHYTTGKFRKDAISEKNDKTHAQGKMVFNTRKKRNFDIPNPLIKYEDILW